ncbi:hypothetical protein, partial [Vibrio breoganii]|uniref:hypothetical protein n=1 Tax=Vibrio breoganii TaxID=553239 RepID=UPI001A7E108A
TRHTGNHTVAIQYLRDNSSQQSVKPRHTGSHKVAIQCLRNNSSQQRVKTRHTGSHKVVIQYLSEYPIKKIVNSPTANPTYADTGTDTQDLPI